MAKEHDRNAEFVKHYQQYGNEAGDVPLSVLDRLLRIWKQMMPQTNLAIEKEAVLATRGSNASYPGQQMSDGERVALYLIGQTLCAPTNSIIIIDEPEIHLHRAIQDQLWDVLEVERTDCLFVYITHDLNFAAGRSCAMKIWMKSFNENVWEWSHVPDIEGFPPELVMRILGTQRPILFVEGDAESEDRKLYQTLYPNHAVIPRGSSYKVIESTKALRLTPGFHGKSAFGLIDRDHRSEEELLALEQDGIYSTPVAEVENIALLPEVITFAATHT